MRTAIGFAAAAAAAALMFSAPSFADSQSDSTRTDNPIICKTQHAATGSRIGSRKVCRTKNEWNAQEAADRDEVTTAQQHSLSAAPPDGGAGSVH